MMSVILFPLSVQLHDLHGRFDKLLAAAKDPVFEGMWVILSGKEQAAKYSRLSAVDRQAVVEILRETKPGLPGYFQSVLH